MLFQVYPKVKERKMYGGIMFSIDEDFAGLFVYKEHVTMEFGNGYLFEDPSEILDGTGKQRRNLKFKTLKDIETRKLKALSNKQFQANCSSRKSIINSKCFLVGALFGPKRITPLPKSKSDKANSSSSMILLLKG